MLKVFGLAALGLGLTDTVKMVSEIRHRETVDLHSHRIRMQMMDRESRDSMARHRRGMRELQEEALHAARVRQALHDAEMTRINKVMEENDASFDLMMAAIRDPNLSEEEKLAAVKAHQPKFR